MVIMIGIGAAVYQSRLGIIKGKRMRNKKANGTETLITIVIAVCFVLSMSWLFSDSSSLGASEHQYQDEPW